MLSVTRGRTGSELRLHSGLGAEATLSATLSGLGGSIEAAVNVEQSAIVSRLEFEEQVNEPIYMVCDQAMLKIS
jgi:hypothetical protein